MLKDLRRSCGCTASALVSREGSILASDIPKEISAETFALMCATIIGAAATANTELERNVPDKIVIESKDGRTIIANAGKNALITVVIPQKVKVEKVLEEIKKVNAEYLKD